MGLKNAGGAILAINPGTTTTRCALYEIAGGSLYAVAERTIEHDETEMARFAADTLPTVLDHLQAARAIVADLADVAVAEATPPPPRE